MNDFAVPDVEFMRSILDYDAESGFFTRKTMRSSNAEVGDVAGSVGKSGYRRIWMLDRYYLAHRLAWLCTYGEWPALHIDHINGAKDDNRIANLRLATRSQNVSNRPKLSTNTSGFKGVTWDKSSRLWCAKIGALGRVTVIGYYKSPEMAHAAYCEAALKYHGEFARV